MFDNDGTIRRVVEKIPLPICRNCRFWERWESGEDADCTKFYAEGLDSDENYKSGNMARASYSDSIIHTGADFGCIHFEINGLSIDEVDGLLKGLDGVPSIIGTKGA